MQFCRAALELETGSDKEKLASALWLGLKNDFPVQWDWILQDGGRIE